MATTGYNVVYNGKTYSIVSPSQGEVGLRLAKQLGLNYIPANIKITPQASMLPQKPVYTPPAYKPPVAAKPTATGTFSPAAPANPAPTAAVATTPPWYQSTLDKYNKILDELKTTLPGPKPQFAFDEKLAMEQIKAEFSPYYTKLIKDYNDNFLLKQQQALGGVSKRLEDITTQQGYQTRKTERELKDAITRNASSLAGRGLAYSGIRGQEENKMTTTTNEALANYIQGLDRSREDLLSNTAYEYGTSALDQFRNPASTGSIIDKLAAQLGALKGFQNTTAERFSEDTNQTMNTAINNELSNRYNEAYNKYNIGTYQPWLESFNKYGTLQNQASSLGSLLQLK